MQMEPDPPSDRNKLNFDAAFKNQGTMAVVVSCNNQAQILKAWTKLFPKGDALWGEVMAALFAISCASEASYSLIIIKGDADNVLMPLKELASTPCWLMIASRIVDIHFWPPIIEVILFWFKNFPFLFQL